MTRDEILEQLNQRYCERLEAEAREQESPELAELLAEEL